MLQFAQYALIDRSMFKNKVYDLTAIGGRGQQLYIFSEKQDNGG